MTPGRIFPCCIPMLRPLLFVVCATAASVLPGAESVSEADRLAAARAADVGWQTSVENLRSDLTSGQVERQLRAVRDIVKRRDPVLTGALLPLLEPGHDPRLTAAVCLAMADLGNTAATAGIQQHLKQQDPNLRQAAYVALTRLGGFTPKQHLEHLHETDPVLRNAALFQLALDPVPDALPALAEAAEHNPDANIRRICTYGLGKSGDGKQAQALRRVLMDRDVRVSGAAATALAQLRDQTSIPSLLLAIENGAVDRETIAALTALAGQDFGLAAATDGRTRRAGVDRGWTWWGVNADKIAH